MGQISDATLQQLSRDRSRIGVETAVASDSAPIKKFEGLHGMGKTLD